MRGNITYSYKLITHNRGLDEAKSNVNLGLKPTTSISPNVVGMAGFYFQTPGLCQKLADTVFKEALNR